MDACAAKDRAAEAWTNRGAVPWMPLLDALNEAERAETDAFHAVVAALMSAAESRMAPCPFCGDSNERGKGPHARLVVDKTLRRGCLPEDSEAYAYAVRCGSCAAMGPWVKSGERAAINAWNRRHGTDGDVWNMLTIDLARLVLRTVVEHGDHVGSEDVVGTVRRILGERDQLRERLRLAEQAADAVAASEDGEADEDAARGDYERCAMHRAAASAARRVADAIRTDPASKDPFARLSEEELAKIETMTPEKARKILQAAIDVLYSGANRGH